MSKWSTHKLRSDTQLVLSSSQETGHEVTPLSIGAIIIRFYTKHFNPFIHKYLGFVQQPSPIVIIIAQKDLNDMNE